jgi:putative phosphoribosyl transferase
MENKLRSVPVLIEAGRVLLRGDLAIPEDAKGLVLFAHGSGSSRKSPRNRYVASELDKRAIATLLFDLLTPHEEEIDSQTGQLRFDIGLLSRRLMEATQWVRGNADTKKLVLGYFGASTGSAAALVAAAELPDIIRAVVSRGGRPDLAESSLFSVKAPVLLIVGSLDPVVIALNKQALQELPSEKKLVTVSGANHLFEEPGTLEEVALLAGDWFEDHL